MYHHKLDSLHWNDQIQDYVLLLLLGRWGIKNTVVIEREKGRCEKMVTFTENEWNESNETQTEWRINQIKSNQIKFQLY